MFLMDADASVTILNELPNLLEVDSLFMEETRKLQKTPSKLPTISRAKLIALQ